MESVRSYLEKFVELARSERDCLYYGFTFCGNKLHFQEPAHSVHQSGRSL